MNRLRSLSPDQREAFRHRMQSLDDEHRAFREQMRERERPLKEERRAFREEMRDRRREILDEFVPPEQPREDQ